MNLLDTETRKHLVSTVAIQSIVHAVKELLENALDANSLNIKITVNDFDITIKDDGTGIPPDGLEMLGIVNCTSKQLLNNKYGHRGSSLKAINAIAKSFSITTKTSQDTIGNKIVNGEKSAVSCAKGTIIEVKGLFYRIPVRMHYLQQNYQKQMAAIKKYVENLHFVNNQCKIELQLNGNIHHYLGYKDRMVIAFNRILSNV